MKRIWLALIIILPVMLEASYDEALNHFLKKEYNESLKVLGSELVIENDFTENSPNYNQRFLAAHNHWQLDNSRSVISHFRRCIDIKKDDTAAAVDLSLFFIDKGHYRDAEVTAARALKIKEDPMLYFVLGRVNLLRKKYNRAKYFFEKTNSLNPEMFFSYIELGICLMHLRQYKEANTAFTIASVLNPNSLPAHFNLGISYEIMDKKEKARDSYLKAQAIDEENISVKEAVKRVTGE